jgi:hypothetical protein
LRQLIWNDEIVHVSVNRRWQRSEQMQFLAIPKEKAGSTMRAIKTHPNDRSMWPAGAHLSAVFMSDHG